MDASAIAAESAMTDGSLTRGRASVRRTTEHVGEGLAIVRHGMAAAAPHSTGAFGGCRKSTFSVVANQRISSRVRRARV